MAVTRLERKGQKNKSRAKQRIATIKRLRTKSTIPSPNKEDSGVVIGSVADIIGGAKPKAKAAKEKVKEEKPAEVVAEAVEETSSEEVVAEETTESAEEAPEASEEKEEKA